MEEQHSQPEHTEETQPQQEIVAVASSCGQRIAFASTLSASVSVLGIGLVSAGSLVLPIVANLSGLLLEAHWLVRVGVVLGGFAALAGALSVIVPSAVVTREHVLHALVGLLWITLAAIALVVGTFIAVSIMH